MTYKEILENTLKGHKYINKNSILDYIEKCCFPFSEKTQTSEKDHFINNIHLAIASLYEIRIEKEQDEIKHLEIDNQRYRALLQDAYKNDFITFKDGFQFKEVSKEYALKNYNKQEIYGLNIFEETESLINNKQDIEDFEIYGIETSE